MQLCQKKGIGLKVSRPSFQPQLYLNDLSKSFHVSLHFLICKIKGLVHKTSHIFLVLISAILLFEICQSALAQEKPFDSGNLLDKALKWVLVPGVVPEAECGKDPNPRATRI